MKTNINGVEIEGTPEEIITLLKEITPSPKLNLDNEKTHKPNTTTTTIKKRRKQTTRATKWTKEEDQSIVNCAQENDGVADLLKLQKILPHRTLSAIEKRAYDLGISLTNTQYSRQQYKRTIIKKRQKQKKHSHKRWTPEEDNTIKKCVRPEINKALLKEILQALPHRTKASIQFRCHQLGISIIKSTRQQKKAIKRIKKAQKQEGLPVFEKYTPKKKDLRRARGKFVCLKSNEYQNKYNWTREKAWSQAVMDWQQLQKKTSLKNIVIVDNNVPFPTIAGIKKDSIQALKSILVSMSQKRIQEFTYETAQNTLMPCEGMWNHNKWYFLVNELLSKSQSISESLGIHNRFKIRRVDDTINLIYG